jgi:hypothetical protein
MFISFRLAKFYGKDIKFSLSELMSKKIFIPLTCFKV